MEIIQCQVVEGDIKVEMGGCAVHAYDVLSGNKYEQVGEVGKFTHPDMCKEKKLMFENKVLEILRKIDSVQEQESEV